MTETVSLRTEIPVSWTRAELQDCADILDSRRVPINSKERQERISDKAESDLFPYYGATGQVGWIDNYIFDQQLVLLGEDGVPFLDSNKPKAYLISGKTWVNNHAHVLTAVQDITSNRFLLYFLNQFDFHGYVTGTTRLKLNQARMREIPVPLPPLNEQGRIVEKIEELFTKLDAGVRSLEQARAQLKSYRRSVLKAAVEGELSREWRVAHKDELEPASELLEQILQERREKFAGKKYKEPASPDTSELPALPDGWEWVTWNQIGISQNGRAFPSKEYSSSGVKLLRPGNLHANGSVQWTEKNTRCMPEKWAADYPSHLVGPRELVINLTAQSLADEFLGRVCLTGREEYCLLNQRIARLTPIKVLPEYLLWMFKSHVFRRYVGRQFEYRKPYSAHVHLTDS